MSDKTITIICIALPVLCVIFSVILFFLEQAAQEAEMFEKKKTRAKINPFKIYLLLQKVIPRRVLFQFSVIYVKVVNLWKYGLLDFPRLIAIEVNTNCNRGCPYCPQSVDKMPAEFIEQPVFLKFIERVKELDWAGVLTFHFNGEPLLHKGLEGLVEFARQECPKSIITIFTNGDALTEKRVESLAAAGVMRFMVTRHPPYSDAWDKKMAGLERKFPKLISCRMIENMPLQNRAGMVIPKTTMNFERGCTVASDGLTVDIHGNYLFCFADYYKKTILGNVFDSSILKVWKEPLYKIARKGVLSGIPILDVCKACFSSAHQETPSEIQHHPV